MKLYIGHQDISLFSLRMFIPNKTVYQLNHTDLRKRKKDNAKYW